MKFSELLLKINTNEPIDIIDIIDATSMCHNELAIEIGNSLCEYIMDDIWNITNGDRNHIPPHLKVNIYVRKGDQMYDGKYVCRFERFN